MITGRRARQRIAQRRREAVDWFLEHEVGDGSPPERLDQWEQWLRNAGNRAEYAAIVQLRQQTRSIPAPPLPSDHELMHDSSDLGVGAARSLPTEQARGLRAWWTSLTERSDVLAAGFAAAGLCFLALIIFELLEPGSPEFPSQRIETARGGQGAVALSDGSQLTLGADTRVLVRFSGGARRLVLERGEARFKVHHDRQHPFVVEAGAGSITAVGTEFVVRRYSTYSHSVRLWVTEGAVEVAPDSVRPNVALSAAEQRLERVRVVQGEGMTYNGEKHTEPTRSADSDLSSELVKGAFLYRGRPLAEVIEDVQRYSVRKIALDPSAGDLRYSGIVLQKNVDQWLRGLPEIFPGLVIEDSADAILIRSAVHGAQAAAKAVIG